MFVVAVSHDRKYVRVIVNDQSIVITMSEWSRAIVMLKDFKPTEREKQMAEERIVV